MLMTPNELCGSVLRVFAFKNSQTAVENGIERVVIITLYREGQKWVITIDRLVNLEFQHLHSNSGETVFSSLPIVITHFLTLTVSKVSSVELFHVSCQFCHHFCDSSVYNYLKDDPSKLKIKT